MKYALSITLCCAFLFLYGIRLPVSGKAHPLNSDSTYTRCTELITWKIGSVDSRYHIDEKTLKDVMTEVGKLWSDAVGRKLVAYSDSGVVTLNLIYSDEQKYTDDKQQMIDRIREMKKKYALMRIKNQKESHKLQNELDKPNNPPSNYTAIIKRYNKLSEELNDYAKEINELIYQYEKRYNLQRTFYQATFNSYSDPKKINIYQFENIDTLKLVLAHEVGHVLGLPHTDSQQAVMNLRPQSNDEKNLQLADVDIQMIRNRCPRLTNGAALIEE